MKMNETVLFETQDKTVTLPVQIESETVWLSLDQMADLFQRDKSTISKHIRNVFAEKELNRESTVANFATVQMEGARRIEREIEHYNLDMIISIGYQVKSKRGIEFRRWANGILFSSTVRKQWMIILWSH